MFFFAGIMFLLETAQLDRDEMSARGATGSELQGAREMDAASDGRWVRHAAQGIAAVVASGRSTHGGVGG